MSDIAKGVGNLFAAVVDIIKGIFATVFNVFQAAINTVLGLFKNVFNLAEGVVGFIIGKIPDLQRASPSSSANKCRQYLHHWHIVRSVLRIYTVSTTSRQKPSSAFESGNKEDLVRAVS
jgi:hypothetical protein